jgi:hypothetical protein
VSNKKKIIKRAALFTTVLLILSIIGFLIYTADYYKADKVAQNIFNNEDSITLKDGYLVLSPEKETTTALIFYPGAKVEYIAYLPILNKIRDKSNIKCILVEMPFNMAIFDSNAADEIMSNFPEVESWYIGGHSMGGAMASNFASKNKERIKGLILMGAYVYGDYPPKDALTIYGKFNTSVGEKIDYTENIIIIEGGNHAQFGNYGKQKGDPDATISTEEQQDITVETVDKFIKDKEN